MAQVAERTGTLAAVFDAFRGDAAFAAGGLGATRDAAFARFTSTGFPTTRHEEWRHTNVQPIAQTEFVRATAVDVPVDTSCAGPGFQGSNSPRMRWELPGREHASPPNHRRSKYPKLTQTTR